MQGAKILPLPSAEGIFAIGKRALMGHVRVAPWGLCRIGASPNAFFITTPEVYTIHTALSSASLEQGGRT